MPSTPVGEKHNPAGGDAVYDVQRLINRVKYLADDRNCWVFNTKMADKEVKRLSALL